MAFLQKNVIVEHAFSYQKINQKQLSKHFRKCYVTVSKIGPNFYWQSIIFFWSIDFMMDKPSLPQKSKKVY